MKELSTLETDLEALERVLLNIKQNGLMERVPDHARINRALLEDVFGKILADIDHLIKAGIVSEDMINLSRKKRNAT